MLVRAINATAFSGFDRIILYWIKDSENENHEAYFQTSGILMEEPDHRWWAYPAWYYISTFVSRLADYAPEKIISEKGNVWIYKYRNKVFPDSAAYFIYCPTHNKTISDNYPLKLGRTASKTVTEILLDDKSATGNLSSGIISNGTVILRVTESPIIILVKEIR
jgi:hypothetical protein